MPRILKGSLSSGLDKIWAQIRQGEFDIIISIYVGGDEKWKIGLFQVKWILEN
jgi:hypothetical protein